MKVNRWGHKRIAHKHIPMIATARQLWNHQEPDSSFFYKIKGSVRLLEPGRSESTSHIQQQHFGTRFNISKRLQALSQSRMKKIKRDSLTARNTERPCETIRLFPHRNSLNNHKPYEPQDVELANVNKTISGTRIGALSSLQIMKNLDVEEQKKQQQQSLRFHKYPNPLDSEPNDQIAQQQTMALIKRPNGTSSKHKKRLKAAKKSKDNEQLLQTIFGGEQFLQKHKQYQTLLMEKSVHYKSKTLSLDYKNEWRI